MTKDISTRKKSEILRTRILPDDILFRDRIKEELMPESFRNVSAILLNHFRMNCLETVGGCKSALILLEVKLRICYFLKLKYHLIQFQ